jgi:hypothetical protein
VSVDEGGGYQRGDRRLCTWHEHHEAARRALDGGLRLIEHCALETHSVLTRLPPPHRSTGDVVCEFIRNRVSRAVPAHQRPRL